MVCTYFYVPNPFPTYHLYCRNWSHLSHFTTTTRFLTLQRRDTSKDGNTSIKMIISPDIILKNQAPNIKKELDQLPDDCVYRLFVPWDTHFSIFLDTFRFSSFTQKSSLLSDSISFPLSFDPQDFWNSFSPAVRNFP